MFPKEHNTRRLVIVLLGLLAVYAVGTIGYMVIEGWNLTDASFMTVITVATVGYGEIHPLSPAGRWFTMGLVLGGMGVLVYGATKLTAFVLEGELKVLLKRSRMDKRIEKLSGHFIVCGAGRVGRYIAEELHRTGHKVVGVEKDPERLKIFDMLDVDIPFVIGDATDDLVLERAGLRRASGLVTTLSTDSDNLFVVLSARQISSSIRIVSRLNDESNANKMLRAGADNTVCPARIGGHRMASDLIRPTVVNFLDTMLKERESTLRMEEAVLQPDSRLVGKTLAEVQIPRKTGCIVVALWRKSGKFEFNPKAETRLSGGDTLVVMGEIQQTRLLKNLASGIIETAH